MPLTPDQIAQMDAVTGLGGQSAPPTMTPDLMAKMDAVSGLGQGTGPIDQWHSDGAKNQARIDAAKNAYSRGEQGIVSTAGQVTGAIANQVGDDIGNVVSHALPMAPIAKEGAGLVADAVLNNPVVNYGAQQIQPAYDAAMQGLDNHPELKRNLQAVGGVANLAANTVAPEAAAPQVEKQLTYATAHNGMDSLADAAGNMIQSGGQKVAGMFATPEAAMTADEIKAEAGKAYNYATAAGGVVKPEVTNQFLDQLASLKPQTEAGKMVIKPTAATQLVDDWQALRNRPLTLDEAQELDEHLGDLIDQHTDMGKLTKVGNQIHDIQSDLRETVMGASPDQIAGGTQGFEALQQGRKLWSKQAKQRDIEKIFTRADGKDNVATVLKNGFSTLANNPKRMRGFTPEEASAIKAAAKSGPWGDTLKIFGSRLNPIIAMAAGAPIAGDVAAHVGSMAARGMAARVQLKKGLRIADMIAQDGKFIEPAAPAADDSIKLLTGPAPEMVGDSAGNISPVAPADQNANIMARQRASDIGLTSDVRAAAQQRTMSQMEMAKNADWDKLDQAQKAQVADQINQMFAGQKPPSAVQMIQEAAFQARKLAQAGVQPNNPAMIEALRAAAAKAKGQ